MRFEDIKLRYTVVIDNLDDLRKHASELPPDRLSDEYDDYEAIVDIMCKWCEQQFGEKTVKWNYLIGDYRIDGAYGLCEDHFYFEEEYQRTLFVLRWS
jgi:hypothetical protein